MKTQLGVDKKDNENYLSEFLQWEKARFQAVQGIGSTSDDTEFETDTGYTGITAIHPNSLLPKKRSKNNPLTQEEKKKESDDFQKKNLCRTCYQICKTLPYSFRAIPPPKKEICSPFFLACWYL